MRTLLIVIGLVLATGATGVNTAAAQEPTPPPAQPAPAEAEDTGPGIHSINVSPLGLLFGNYSLNYEYLLIGYHGFLVEGAYSSSSDDNSEASSFGLGGGYRLHWSGEQDSGFLGLQAFYGVGTAEATVSGGGVDETFELDVTTVYIAPNLGARYAWDMGFNITWRFGIGWAKHTVSSNRDEDEVQDAIDQVNDLLEFVPFAIDAELSIGYIF